MSRYEIPRAGSKFDIIHSVNCWYAILALRIMANHSSLLSAFYIRHEGIVFEKLQVTESIARDRLIERFPLDDLPSYK